MLGLGGIKLASAASPVKIMVNGVAVNSKGAKIEDGTTLVPVRFVSEALGAKVDWDGASGTVSITTGNCAGCHTMANVQPKTQQGKMNCVACHDDHTK